MREKLRFPYCRSSVSILLFASCYTGLSNDYFLSRVYRVKYTQLNSTSIYGRRCRDSVSWAVHKRLNRSRCSLGCWVGWVQGTRTREDVDDCTGTGTFGVSGRLKSIVKHRILWVLLKE